MRKHYLIINGLAILGVVSILGCEESTIIHRKKIEKDIREYKTANVIIQCDDWRARKDPRNVAPLAQRKVPEYVPSMIRFLKSAIRSELNASGIKEYDGDKPADMIVSCHFRVGWCIPFIGRSLDMHFMTIRTVNIKLIDRKTDGIVAEADYIRSRQGSVYEEYIMIPAMIKEILRIKAENIRPRLLTDD